MNIVDAFLATTVMSFVFGVIYPRPITNFRPAVEKPVFLVQGLFLGLNLLFNVRVLWLVLGLFWPVFVGLDFIGFIKYRTTSEGQMFMTTWDFLIAVSCLLKA